jgi:hypothetical protein
MPSLAHFGVRLLAQCLPHALRTARVGGQQRLSTPPPREPSVRQCRLFRKIDGPEEKSYWSGLTVCLILIHLPFHTTDKSTRLPTKRLERSNNNNKNKPGWTLLGDLLFLFLLHHRNFVPPFSQSHFVAQWKLPKARSAE